MKPIVCVVQRLQSVVGKASGGGKAGGVPVYRVYCTVIAHLTATQNAGEISEHLYAAYRGLLWMCGYFEELERAFDEEYLILVEAVQIVYEHYEQTQKI